MNDPNPPPCPEDRQLERPKYFSGQFLTADDLAAEQSYFLDKQRTHNRHLHGHGVVCGLAVEATDPASDQVVVQPGMAIDCCGREIVVEEPITLDPRALLEGPATGGRIFVSVAYDETDVAPAPAPGADDEHVATRVREGARVDVAVTRPPVPATASECFPCPPCADPRVALAAIDVSRPGPIADTDIDNGVRSAIGTASHPSATVESLERRLGNLRRLFCAGAAASFAVGWLIRRR